jgi:hypothetical protein
MLKRVIVFSLLVSAGGAAWGWSYSFRTTVSGSLQGPITFQFYGEATTRAKTDIVSFGVCVRTPDHTWRPVWSIDGGRRVVQPIRYGVSVPGFTTRTPAQKLHSGHTYMTFASARGGGSSNLYFRFQKDGAITFPNSPD